MRTITPAFPTALSLVAVLAFPSGARAGAAEELVSKCRQAIGAGHAIPPDRAIRLEGATSLLGMSSTTTLLIGPAGTFRMSTTGPVSMAQGVYDRTPWRHDIGGEVTTLHFAEAEELLATAAIISGAWATQDASTSTFTLDPARQDPQKPWTLALADAQGRSRGDITIDRDTLRPTGATIRTGSGTQTITLSGWLQVGDRWFPGSVSTSAGRGDSTGYAFTSAEETAFDPAAFRPDFTPPADTTYDVTVLAAIEVKKAKTGHLLVRPKINGADAGWWIFDTGAGGAVIDAKSAESLSLRPFGSIPVVGLGGSITSQIVRPESFTLGPVTIASGYMTTLDLSGIAAAMGEPIAGVVGYNLMHRCIVRLDMLTPAVELLDARTFKDDALPWQKMWVYERHPAVEATIEGVTGPFKLDSGAGGMSVFMHSKTVVDMKLLSRETKDSMSGGVGGMKPVKLGTLASFTVAGKTYENLVATFSLAADGPTADEQTLGTIGGKVLRDFTLVMDYRGERIAFLQRIKP